MEDLARIFPDMPIVCDFQFADVGLMLNERDECNFWQPGEIVQYWGTVNSVKVWIHRESGRMRFIGGPGFRVAFGECPEWPDHLLTLDEAVRMLRDVLSPSPQDGGGA